MLSRDPQKRFCGPLRFSSFNCDHFRPVSHTQLVTTNSLLQIIGENIICETFRIEKRAVVVVVVVVVVVIVV